MKNIDHYFNDLHDGLSITVIPRGIQKREHINVLQLIFS